MQSSEIIEEDISSLHFLLSESNDENDDYDENLDDYDINKEDNYDDGIANSNQDDGYEDEFDEDSDELDSETARTSGVDTLLPEELKDSLTEIEDYDEIDD